MKIQIPFCFQILAFDFVLWYNNDIEMLILFEQIKIERIGIIL